MKTLEIRVREALDLPQGSVEVKGIGVGRSIVTVVDSGFERLTEFERQSRVWDALESRGIDTCEISLIMANTPEEDRVLREQRTHDTDEPEVGTAEVL